MILVFKTEADAIKCEEQIFQHIQRNHTEGGHKVVDGVLIYKQGKQGMVRWSSVTKANTGLLKPNKWYIACPKSNYPDLYEDMVRGFDFEVMETPPEEWQRDEKLNIKE